jgi:hypothetical protein
MNTIFGLISFVEPIEKINGVINNFIKLNLDNTVEISHEKSLFHHIVTINQGNNSPAKIICNKFEDSKKTWFFIETDIFGFEPVYYFFEKNIFYFSSFQRHLIPFLDCPVFNENILYELFTFGFVLPPDTLIKNIYSLPTRKILRFDGKVELLDRAEESVLSVSFTNEKSIYSHLISGLKKEISAQKNIGILYSGGLDSTLLVSAIENDLHQSANIFTVLSNDESIEFQKAEYVKKNLQTKNYCFKPEKQDFWRAVYQSILYGESEMVGSLSLNAPVEYLFAEYIAQQSIDIALTGDDNWITPQSLSSQTAKYYSLKYGLLSGELLKKLFQPRLSSYLYCNYKFQHLLGNQVPLLALKNNRWEIHSMLIGKINGKIRMRIPNAPSYYFPLLDKPYRDYVSTLNLQDSDFNYRDFLKHTLKKSNIFEQSYLDCPKTWMPSFFDGNEAEDIINMVMKKVTLKHNFIDKLFGKDIILQTLNQCEPLAKIKLMMMLLYLVIFHQIFIENKGKITEWEILHDQ